MSDDAIIRLEAWLRAYGEIKQREFTADLRAVLQLARDAETYRKREAAATIEELMGLCRDMWGARRNMAYGPNATREMLEKYPWLNQP